MHSVIHTLRSPDPNTTPFEVTPCGGDIRVKEGAALDYHADPGSAGNATYELLIHADDGNLGNDTLVVRIHVADVDEPPEVLRFCFYIFDRDKNGYIEARARAARHTAPV